MNLDKTALIVIDLQEGLINMRRDVMAPHSWEVISANTELLLEKFQAAGQPIALVNVKLPDRDEAFNAPFAQLIYADWLQHDGVHAVTKYAPSALGETELLAILQTHGVEKVMITGFSSTVGVAATALDAHELGFDVIIVEDASTGSDAVAHVDVMTQQFPAYAKVVTTAEVLQ